MLVEASLTVIVLSLIVAALMPVFVLSIRAGKGVQRLAVSTQLCVELMEEVKLRKWDERTPEEGGAVEGSPFLGPESDEDRTDKRTFDDIDDFDGWKESPPLDPLMKPLQDFNGYSRDVRVRYVDDDLHATSRPTELKQITVCTRYLNGAPQCLDTIVASR